jgi:hypothetical protein
MFANLRFITAGLLACGVEVGHSRGGLRALQRPGSGLGSTWMHTPAMMTRVKA